MVFEQKYEAKTDMEEPGQEEQDIYRFMKEQYNQSIKNGNTYEDEIYDPQITALVGREFNISAEEAKKIYQSVELKINDDFTKEFK
ncbi:hypothetical protein [Domibacillus indicus]|uniref:hypothetical protein n=1 Tax=Domibacillus indicus TaxID=1437523 RepID=UPI00061829AC|nr:hypothetical protein [Domibacillus indicus]